MNDGEVLVNITHTGKTLQPSWQLTTPPGGRLEKLGTLADKLLAMEAYFQESNLAANITTVSNNMANLTTKCLSMISTIGDGLSTIDMAFDVLLVVNGLYQVISKKLDPSSIMLGVYGVYKLVRMFVHRLPPFLRQYFPNIMEKVDEFFDPLEVGSGEVLGSTISMAYTGLIMMLPAPVRMLLDSFQKYTRVKILDDLDWLYDIADVILHIPVYILGTIQAGLGLIGSEWSERVSSALQVAIDKYESIMFFIPELRTVKLVGALDRISQEVSRDRRLLANPAYIKNIKELLVATHEHMNLLRVKRNDVPRNMQALYTEVNNHYRAGVFLVQKSHPEPVAILLVSKPGQGKTRFIQQVREHLTSNGKNTVYDYTPTDGRSDFHDQYQDQNVWIHEDIGQRGPQDWSQYILHIGMNPSRMDGAALDKKSTIFFRSQVILGTSNKMIHRVNLVKAKDCGWEDVNAINRRWLVVEFPDKDKFDIDAPNCKMYKFNVNDERWHEQRQRINCYSPKVFCDTLKSMYVHNIQDHKKMRSEVTTGVDFSFSELGQTEGRTVTTQRLETPQAAPTLEVITPEPGVDDGSCVRRVVTANGEQQIVVNYETQLAWIAQGLYINGAQVMIVGKGDLFVGTKEWCDQHIVKQTDSIWEHTKEMAADIFRELVGTLSALNSIIPLEYKILGGAFVGLAVLIPTILSYRSKPDASQFQPFLHWAKVDKRVTAKELFKAEGKPVLKFEEPPTEALAAVSRNVLWAVVSYDTVSVEGYIVVVNAETIVFPAHYLLQSTTRPTQIFIRALDRVGRECISAFFNIVKTDLSEDIAVACYRDVHIPQFRALNRALIKTPSNKCIYLATTDGVLKVGEPSVLSVRTGVYQQGGTLFHATETVEHSYDGISSQAAGLCGALAVTMDGHVVGWHVANLNQKGMIRFWPPNVVKFIMDAEDNSSVPIFKDTEILGARVLDDNTYHHVHLKSGLTSSAMKDIMEQDPVLCPTGKVEREPAVLGGYREIDGQQVRTYQASREKNLKVVEKPVNIRALDFAKLYIRRMIASVIPRRDNGKIRRLSEMEMVKGFSNEDGVLRPVNKDASAGVPFGGLVSDWVDTQTGKMHKEVLQRILECEMEAKRNVKTHTSILLKDCNKDEIRDSEKKDKPRCFAAGPLHFTMLMRKWFGRLSAFFMQHRMRTGVMIGINATSCEWRELWLKLGAFPHWFDGDYEMWDGAMRREFQEELNSVLSAFCEDPVIGAYILSHLCETVHIGMDMSYITTHSVPSGHGLTALYNSLINKMYVAYAWYLTIGYQLKLSDDGLCVEMDKQLYVPVYGDDIVLAVTRSIAEKFNALSYGRIMRDLGLGFTAATKKPHTVPFVPLRDITFLKRKFVANRQLQDIVGPLDLKVLRNTAAFVHDGVRDHEITRSKMDSIQRELFLHPPEVYQEIWSSLQRCYKIAFGEEFYGLTENDMAALYKKGELRSDLFEVAQAESQFSLPSRRKGRKLATYR